MKPKRHRQQKPDTLTIAYLHPGDVSAIFAYSLVRVMLHESYRAGVPPRIVALRCGSGQLVEARNQIVQSFLATGGDWLLNVDSDMGFPHDTAERLIGDGSDLAVGALCFGLKRRPGGEAYDEATQAVHTQCYPTVYTFHETDEKVGFLVTRDYERDALISSAGTGAACFVAHRQVFADIEAQYGPVWFDRIKHPKDDTLFSEDLSFWVRAAGAGHALKINTKVKTAHDKGGVHLTEELWDAQQALVTLADANYS